MWGGHNGWDRGSAVPWDAIDKWEADYGWEGQHHLIWCAFGHAFRRDHWAVPVGLARRIVEGGGWVQVNMAGTPPALATVPLDQVDPWNNRLNYMKHKPKDNEAWVKDYFMPVLRGLHKRVGLEKLFINCWHEPNFFWWRDEDEEFWDLYGATDKAVQEFEKQNGVTVTFGGCQLANIQNARGSDPNDPWYIRGTIQQYLKGFLDRANRDGWKLDYMDFFKYDHLPSRMVAALLEMEDIFEEAGRGNTEFVFNAMSHAGRRDFHNIDPNTQQSAEHLLACCKMIHKHTKVNRGGFDFLEDGEGPQSSHWAENGLLEYETLRERPRYQAIQKVYDFMDKGK